MVFGLVKSIIAHLGLLQGCNKFDHNWQISVKWYFGIMVTCESSM